MTAEANVMRIASSTMSEVRMKTWLAASAASSPTTAMPPQAMPLPSSSQMNLLRQVSTRTSPRGCARNLWHAAIMKNFMEMTVASQAEACTTGAQNIEASEKMTASSGMVTRAESSFLTNIDRSSYSNSGFKLVPWERRARSSRICACSGRARVLGAWAGRRAGAVVAAVHRLPRQAGRPMQIQTAGASAWMRPDRPNLAPNP